MGADKETPVDAQREANVERVQRWWEEYQKSRAVSARAIEELVTVAVLETVAPELLTDAPTPHQLVLL